MKYHVAQQQRHQKEEVAALQQLHNALLKVPTRTAITDGQRQQRPSSSASARVADTGAFPYNP